MKDSLYLRNLEEKKEQVSSSPSKSRENLLKN